MSWQAAVGIVDNNRVTCAIDVCKARIHEMHYGSLLGKIYVRYRWRFIHPCGRYNGNKCDEERRELCVSLTSGTLTIKRRGRVSLACTINKCESPRLAPRPNRFATNRASFAFKCSSITHKRRARYIFIIWLTPSAGDRAWRSEKTLRFTRARVRLLESVFLELCRSYTISVPDQFYIGRYTRQKNMLKKNNQSRTRTEIHFSSLQVLDLDLYQNPNWELNEWNVY